MTEFLTGLAYPASKPKEVFEEDFIPATYEELILSATPRSYYRFSETSGAGVLVDETGNQPIAVPGDTVNVDLEQPSIVPGSSSPYSVGLFSSNSKITAANATNSMPNLTYELFYQPSAIELGALIEGGGTGDGTVVGMGDDGRVYVWGPDNPTMVSARTLKLGKTYHIVFTYDKNNIRRLFINGRVDSEGPAANANGSGSGGGSIGAPSGSSSAPTSLCAQGIYAEVAAYQNHLTKQQVRSHFKASKIRRVYS